MAREIPGQRLVYSAAAIVILVTAIWALSFAPRSSEIFLAVQLMAAVVFLVCVILSRRGGRIISGLLYLAEALVFLHDFMVFDGFPPDPKVGGSIPLVRGRKIGRKGDKSS